MLEAPTHPEEAKRLELLKACKILYTPAEQAYDDVAALAAELCGAEIALITLSDTDYQWFKAKVGVEHLGIPRDMSFCGHCISSNATMIVEDTLQDPRFADNPLVTGDPRIRFYAGVPLEIEEGLAVGAISVADRMPRSLSARQLAALRRLGLQVSRQLRLRRDLERARAEAELPIGPGTIVSNRWEVTRLLGRGSVGAVFEAKDKDNVRVAIKLLLPAWASQEAVVERFAREARVLMRLQTPHVGRLLDVGNLNAEDGDLPFLVLEYLEGNDLDALLRQRGPLDYRQAFLWCADACDGVAEAHSLGVIHRDIKPSNVFLANGGDGPVVKVLDFGLARDPSSTTDLRITQLESMLGSPAYMAPEQMVTAQDVDARSDIWSMGALLYELLTGQLPFPGETELAMFAAALTKPPLPVRAHVDTDIPFEAEAVLLRCLRKERGDRFASMGELGAALRSTAA